MYMQWIYDIMYMLYMCQALVQGFDRGCFAMSMHGCNFNRYMICIMLFKILKFEIEIDCL